MVHRFSILLNILLAIPCDKYANTLPPGSPPSPHVSADHDPSNPWNPFPDRVAFEFADYHFTKVQSSEARIDDALDHWLASVILAGGDINSCPWTKTKEMYKTIDSIKEGLATWTTVQFRYTGQLPKTPPKWMLETYELRFRNPHTILVNQIASPDFKDHFDYVPYMQFNNSGERVWSNLMSGSWSWQEAVRVSAQLFFYTHSISG
jgi:hypothetical protein